MMRAVFAALLALCTSVSAQTVAGSPPRNDSASAAVLVNDTPQVVFLNTYTGVGYWTYPRGQWVRVDLKPYGVPYDAVAAILHGTLIVSMGAAPDLGLVAVHFRRPGAVADCTNSPHYTEAAGVSWGGSRAPFSDIVPLVNGEMEVCIRTVWGSPPNGISPAPWEASFSAFPSFGVNARLRGWLK